MAKPKDWDSWKDGVLGGPQLKQLAESRWLIDVESNAEFSASSLDLHPSGEGWQLPYGSVKPMGEPYLQMLESCDLVRPLDQTGGNFTLQPGSTYLFRLRERLKVSELVDHDVHGQATAKSSVGRMDVLARLIVDGMNVYESFDPQGLSKSEGALFLEITPITFPVVVRPKEPLTQIRLFKGKPSPVNIADTSEYLLGSGGTSYLSVDLTPVDVGGLDASAFRARSLRSLPPVPLWKNPTLGERPKPWEYWDLVKCDAHNRLMIESGRFYILRSKERIHLPEDKAVYCKAINETIGEIRIHYAGFVHPGFGRERADKVKGTPLIFEVRGHGINANLADGERLAQLEFYDMSLPVKPEVSGYGDQNLKLSGFFQDWPSALQIDTEDVSVVPNASLGHAPNKTATPVEAIAKTEVQLDSRSGGDKKTAKSEITNSKPKKHEE